MYSIYTSTTGVTTLTPYSISVLFSSLIYRSIVVTSVSTSIVTTVNVTAYTSSGAFCEKTGAFWVFLIVFIFCKNADTTIDPPLRASFSHGLL